MPVSHAFARQFVGKQVIAECIGGRRYYGIVQDVTQREVIMQLVGPGAGYVSTKNKDLKLTKASKPRKAEVEQVQWGYPGVGYPGIGYPGIGYGYPGYGAGLAYSRIALPLYVILALSLPFVI
ncbi:hypothetical protein [Ammoniphilus sp. YIM 78166]|uniref:hypothetical protein n=1 Tax=Ammoniphilus sp. YIM 78166 TaxID=1644106 RepID=UPI00196AE33C|nr:hypothetical protein [Ammoniphilus sp. YIM 78166]